MWELETRLCHCRCRCHFCLVVTNMSRHVNGGGHVEMDMVEVVDVG